MDVIDEYFGMVVGLVVVRGEECGAAFRNGERKMIFSEVVLKGARYVFVLASMVGMSVPVDMILMSSAYWERAVLGSVGRGMSCM